jgi:serine/threonine-protein kinase
MRQVCGSLEEAHGHGIVHRDLKPDNVVLTERAGQKDWVEVLDFGIAKRSSEHDPNEAKLTQQGMVLGTPPYMSPEQFTGQPVDVRSDIYALGVMAYEMLTGKLPWEANTAWEWASKHMTEPPTPLDRQPLGPNVPERMRNAIGRALAKNKDERFASVKEFFAAFSGGEAIPSVDAALANAPVSGGNQPSRAKTEMAQPMIGGPAPAVATPPYGGPGGPPPQGAVAIPAGPAHGGPQAGAKKGNMGLVIGLGGLAAVLLIGAGIAVAVGGKKKTVEPPPIDTSATASATPEGSVAATDTAAPALTTAEPLTSAAPALDPNAGKPSSSSGGTPGGGTGKTTNPSGGKTTPAPIPTPKPAAETKECATYHSAKSSGQKPAILAALEAKCRASGGTP